MNPQEAFEADGFLNDQMGVQIAHIRSEVPEWFRLAEDTNRALVQLTYPALDGAKVMSWAPESVAVRILLRASGALQGAVLLAERGMVSESRSLVRGVIECALHMAALVSNPNWYVERVKEDFEKSRHRQAKFLHSEKFNLSESVLEKLQATIDEIGSVKELTAREIATKGPLKHLYLYYQRLSDDSVHLTARSLHRYVWDNGDGSWLYRIGPGQANETMATLQNVIMAAIAVGDGVTQLIKQTVTVSNFGALSDRLNGMPRVAPI